MPPSEHIVGSGGADIHYLAWGPEGAPGLVFVHGGAAHAHWWSFLVPLLADDHRVAALDLSGHGDSGRRDEYTLDAWCDEVLAVANDAAGGGEGPGGPRLKGGKRALADCATTGTRVRGTR